MRNTDYADYSRKSGIPSSQKIIEGREKGRLRRFKRQIILRVTLACLLFLWPGQIGYGLLVTLGFAQDTESLKRQEKLQNAQKHYAAGKELIRQGNYAAANQEFKEAQGLLEGASDHSQSQAQDALKAIVPETNQPAGSGLASDSQNHQPAGQKDGNADETLSFYLKAIKLAPKDIDRHYNLALLYLKTKQYKEAAACLEKVIQLNPKDKDAYYNLGVLYESYLGDRPEGDGAASNSRSHKKKALDYYAQYIKYGSAKGDALEIKQWIRQLKKELKK